MANGTIAVPPKAGAPVASGLEPSGADESIPTLRYVSFNQLRSFHAVAAAGSVTRAAEMLHVSQPTVTTQLRQLESAYGVELVHRAPRGLQLTELGRRLFAITERIFALEAQAVDLLKDASGLLTGKLRVGGVGPFFVMRMLAAFARRYPPIQLSLALGNSEWVIRNLDQYGIDVGIVGRPVGEKTGDSGIVAVPFSRQKVVFFVHRDHRWAGREGIQLTELPGEALIMRKPGSVSRLVLERALEEAEVNVDVALEVNREGVFEAVAAGLGVGLTTEAEFRADDRLHMLRILDADVQTEAVVVSLRERQEGPLVRAFMEFAAEMAMGFPKGLDEAEPCSREP